MFLHSADLTRMTERAMNQIEDGDLLPPAMMMLELEMLQIFVRP
jgi:hypothetical protein